MRKLLFILSVLLLPLSAFATNYYVTQSGTGTGTSSSSPWSVATYNASTTPTGGDTVYFSGTITSTVTPNSGGTGNGAGRLVLDFSGATLTTAQNRIMNNGKSYITYLGGGSWAQGSGGDSIYNPGCTFGALSGGANCFNFNAQTAHDITIQGFQSVLSPVASYSSFVQGVGGNTVLIVDNNIVNMSNFYFADGVGTHHITFRNNYFKGAINTTDQSDIIAIGDGHDVIIEGNKFIIRAPGSVAGRHNDVIQFYRSGSSNSGNPYGITVRYNWFQQSVSSGSGDVSFSMLESISDGGGTSFGLKAYSNVFYGDANDTAANNGFGGGDSTYHTVYCYNNTFIVRAGPGSGMGWNGSGLLWSRNNLCYSVNSFWDGSSFTLNAGATWDRNFYYNWQAPSSLMAGLGGSLSTNPNFTDLANDDFSLGASSTLRGKGDSTIGAEYNQGIAYGATWPNPTLVARGSSWDVGAYQYSSGTSSNVAPTNAKISVTIP